MTRPRLPIRLSLPALLALLASCGQGPDAEAGLGSVPVERARGHSLTGLRVPSGGGSFPDLAPAPGGTVQALWTEPLAPGAAGGRPGHRLRTATLSGGAFGEPDPVAEGSGWFVNWADVPRLAVGPGGERAVTWLEKLGAGTYAYGIRLAVDPTGDGSWGAPRWLHADRSETEHGFASLAPLGQGRFAAVWLDGRATAGGGHGAVDGHGGHGAGAMALRAALVEPDGSTSGEVELDGRVCDCCPTAIARLDDGSQVVAYRDRGEDEVRDISIVRGHVEIPGSWSAPSPVHDDRWRMPGCPVNGPALAARGREVLCAWFTLGPDDTPKVWAARSEDGARSFGRPRRIDQGDPIGRPALAPLTGGRWALAWLEQTGPETAAWRARILGPDGTEGEPVTLGEVPAGRPTGYLALAPTSAGVVALWTDPEGPGLIGAELGAH